MAAVRAAILSRDKSEEQQDLLLLDVISFSIGIKTTGIFISQIIKHDSTIPTQHTQAFTTYTDTDKLISENLQ